MIGRIEQGAAERIDFSLDGVAFFLGVSESGHESDAVFRVIGDIRAGGVAGEFSLAFIEPFSGGCIECCLLGDVEVGGDFLLECAVDGLIEAGEGVSGSGRNFATEAGSGSEIPCGQFLRLRPPGGFEHAGGGLKLVNPGDEFSDVDGLVLWRQCEDVDNGRDFRAAVLRVGDWQQSVVASESADVKSAWCDGLDGAAAAWQQFPFKAPAIFHGGECGACSEQIKACLAFGRDRFVALDEGFGEFGFDIEPAREYASGEVKVCAETDKDEEVEDTANVFVHRWAFRMDRDGRHRGRPSWLQGKTAAGKGC